MLPQFENFRTEDITDLHLCFWYKHECHLMRHPNTGKWHIDTVEKKPFMPNPPEAEDLGWMLWGKDEKWGKCEFDSPEDAIKFLQSGVIPY